MLTIKTLNDAKDEVQVRTSTSFTSSAAGWKTNGNVIKDKTSNKSNGQCCGLGPLLKRICSKSYKFVLVSVSIWYPCPLKG